MTPLAIACLTGIATLALGIGLFFALCVFADAWLTIRGIATDEDHR